eukprot:365443-Chlamydomonas_euryale.AAC.9
MAYGPCYRSAAPWKPGSSKNEMLDSRGSVTVFKQRRLHSEKMCATGLSDGAKIMLGTSQITAASKR